MALCPHCYHILNFWDVKAECPHCGVNIPNYKWEERLDEDARNAAIAWEKFHRFTGNFKSALFGTKLRILRFVCTFLPLIALVLPLAKYTLNLPFVNSAPTDFSLLDFSMNTLLTLNWGSLLSLVSTEVYGIPVLLLGLSVLLLYLAVVFGVLNFVFILLKASSLKAGANTVLCACSLVCFIASAVMFTVCVAQISTTTAVFISGTVQYGWFVGTTLFALNTLLNIIVNKTFKKQRAQL